MAVQCLEYNQQANNYTYDRIGNLISDVAEEIENIEWTVYGKIKSITRTANSTKPNLSFEYTPDGHRVAKHVTDSVGQTTSTYYIRDASGTVMATYQRKWNATFDTTQVTIMDIYDYLEANSTVQERLLMLDDGDGLHWSQDVNSSHLAHLDQELQTANKVRDMINSFSPTAFISGTTFDAMYTNTLNTEEIIAALRSASYTDDQIVSSLCGHCYADFAQTLVNADYNTFLHLMSMTHAWAFDQLLIHLNINQMGWPLDKQIDVIMAQMTVADLVTFLEPYLQCQDWAMIYGMHYTSGSVESTNLLLSIPGIKDCIKNAFTQHEIMDALVLHLGVVNTWTIIFQTEPGTENSYLPALRNANKRRFLYQSMLLLNSNTTMRYYIENHTEPNTTVAEWKAAVKKSFGLNYYNDMLLEISEQYATLFWVYELQEQYMYGSSRLGSVQRNLPLVQQVLNSDSLLYYSYANDSIRYMERGQKRMELSNHLGNVLAVVTDRKLVHCSNDELMWFEAQVVSVTDYYPFGMEIKERTWSVSSYRYGFNGMERDDELKGSGNSYTAEFWQYDPRTGRRWNTDPIIKFHESPYACIGNNPIWLVDLNGADTTYALKDAVTGKWDITKTTIAKGDDVFRVTYGDEYSKQIVFPEGEYGKRFNVLNVENNDDYTLGIYHISGEDGEGATGFTVTPGGSASTKEGSGKRLPDDTYTLNGTGGHSAYKWVQPLIHTGTNGGYVGGRGVKIHPAPSKLPETKANQWTAGCYVVCTDYSLKEGTIYYKSKLSIKTSKQINTMLGATKHYNAVGKKSRPGSDFSNGIQFKLIQKTGF